MKRNKKLIAAGITGATILVSGVTLAGVQPTLLNPGIVGHAESEGREITDASVNGTIVNHQGASSSTSRVDDLDFNIRVNHRVKSGDKIILKVSNLDLDVFAGKDVVLGDGTVIGKVNLLAKNTSYFDLNGVRYYDKDMGTEELNDKFSVRFATSLDKELNPGFKSMTPSTEIFSELELVFNNKAEDYESLEFKLSATNVATSLPGTNVDKDLVSKLFYKDQEITRSSYHRPPLVLTKKVKGVWGSVKDYIENTPDGATTGRIAAFIQTDEGHPLKKGDRITLESRADSNFKYKTDGLTVGKIFKKAHGSGDTEVVNKFSENGILIHKQNYPTFKIVEATPDRITYELMSDSYDEDISFGHFILATDGRNYNRDTNKLENIKQYITISSSDPGATTDTTLQTGLRVIGYTVGGGTNSVKIQYKTTQWIDEGTNKAIKPSTLKETTDPAGEIDDYTFVRTATDQETGNVTHYFRHTPKPKTFTIYQDEEGNELKKIPGTAGTTEVITGYKFLRETTDSTGNKILIYRKVFTKFIGHDGSKQTELKSVAGEKEKEEFKGYRYERFEAASNGDWVYHYNKIYTIYQDESGNVLKKVEGDVAKPEEIAGYKLVRNQVDTSGNKVFVLHKLKTDFIGHNGNKQKTLKSKDGLVDKEEIVGYKFDRTETLANGDRIHHYTQLKTIFRDENGNELKVAEGALDNPGDIPGYKLIRVDTDENGNKIPIYHKIQTKFVGHDGNQTSEIKSVDGLVDKEEIKNYKFIRTEEASNGDRIHHYNKLYTIIKDENGKVIKRIPGVENNPETPAGYKLIRVDTDNEGNRIPIYHKIQTIHKGHDGNQETTLKVSDGLSNKENFDTYKFDRTEEAENGDRIHHYNKLYTILRDEKGNEIKRIPGIVGEDAFSNLPGYKLIRVDTDENGNKIPIYHKIQTKFVSHDKGKETILKIVDGEVEKEDLKGQKFVRTETLNNGDRVHHYNKTYTISTDDKGNELGRVIGTDGKPMELPGYKLIRVDHDENGNLIPIYHKIQTFYKGHDGTEVVDLEVVDNLADKKDFSGYKFDKTEEVENGDRIHHYVKLHTIYQDENGNELSRDHSINGELRDLPGYKLIRVDTDENGNKIPVYHKLVTRFVTMENDKEIELKVEDGLVEKSDIKNYRYVKTTEDKTLGDRIHHYEPLYTILRDENGNEIGRIKGVVEPEEKPGYKLIRVDTDENGNKIPIYHKIQTKFVSSENGKDELLKTVDGTVEKEEIEGYQFTKSEVDETLGDTIHHYSPLYTILKDENGRVIKTIKGLAEPEDLPGYKLIRVDTDSEGNKVPVYHKIQTKFVYEENGKEVVIKTLDGTQPDEKLDGFNYLKTSVDEKLGDTIHYYQKDESNKENDEWTVIKDENGRVIKRIKGRLKESDLENYLPGYKLMRIERDDNGNLTPIYHKILTQFITERNGKPFVLKTLEGTHEKEEIDGYEFESTNVDDATGDTIHHYKLKPKTVEQKESVKTGASASSFVLPGVGILGLLGALSFAGYKRFKKRKN